MDKRSRSGLALYFFLAFAITWSTQIPGIIAAHNRGLEITNEANLFHLSDLFGGRLDPRFRTGFLLFVFAFGPSVAGIIATAIFRGRRGLADLFRRLVNVRIPLRWVGIILGIAVALPVTALGLGFVLSGFKPIEFSFLVPLSSFFPFLLYMLVFTGLAEELGWRGYALPELQRNFTAEKSSWIVGVFWGLWHLPTNLLAPYLRDDLTVPFAISIVAALTFGIVGWTIVLTWIYNNTGSLFWIVVLHGVTNTLQSYLILSSNNEPAQFLYAALPWGLAIYLLKRYGGEKLLAPAAKQATATRPGIAT